MSEFRDFTSYNEEAENIRPTARIQLIQRILNAASLISSLGQGVPLRWAQSYKSFQVLKYVSGQDPLDVTSSNAVSSVDSILHEAESQLRASNDDLNTLCTELENMELQGHASVSALPKLEPNHYYPILTYNDNNGNGPYYILLETDGNGHAKTDKLGCCNYSTLQAMIGTHSADLSFMGPENICCMQRFVSASNKYQQFSAFWNESYTNPVPLYAIGSVLASVSPNDGDLANRTLSAYLSVFNSESGRISKSWIVNSSSSSIYPNNLVEFSWTTASNDDIKTAGALQDSGSVPIDGSIPSETALGLPDPTNLIEILDNMVQ